MVEFLLVATNSQRRDEFTSYFSQYQESHHYDGKLEVASESQINDKNCSLFADVLLIDLSFDSEKMFALACEFRTYNPEAVIILMSDDDAYALQGYEITAFRYLVHPVSYDTFAQGLDDTFVKLLRPNHSYVFLPIDRRMKKIYLNDIIYIARKGVSYFYKTRFGNYEADNEINFSTYQRLGFASYKGDTLINLFNLSLLERDDEWFASLPLTTDNLTLKNC